jgi:hypothetical protein
VYREKSSAESAWIAHRATLPDDSMVIEVSTDHMPSFDASGASTVMYAPENPNYYMRTTFRVI